MIAFSGIRPEPKNIEHSVICRSDDHYCGHPRCGGLKNFGNGQIAMLHWHSPCRYSSGQDVHHTICGYKRNAVMLLQRSFDGGRTWPREHNVVVHDESVSLDERRAYFFGNPNPRERLDMSSPDAMFYFGVSFSGSPIDHGEEVTSRKVTAYRKGDPSEIVYVLRSIDRGQTWEKAPFVIPDIIEGARTTRQSPQPIRLDDGTLIADFVPQETGDVLLYASEDDGLSWYLLSRIASKDTTPHGRPAYPNLVLLPSGRLLCIMLHLRHGPLIISQSDNGGHTWSDPEPIVRQGRSPWRDYPPMGHLQWDETMGPCAFVPYRAPWPLMLRDGRVLILYTRRQPPFGIGGLISEDQGQTWSDEFVLRADATWSDIGYNVVTELDDGTIFTAYYFVTDTGKPPYQLRRYIAGTHFRI